MVALVFYSTWQELATGARFEKGAWLPQIAACNCIYRYDHRIWNMFLLPQNMWLKKFSFQSSIILQ